MNNEVVAFADAGLFMGMHNGDEAVRIACKNFFVGRIGRSLSMTLDQVGLCDDIVWRQTREVQDLYYPFMDQLHTLLAAKRVAYSRADIRRAGEDPCLTGLEGAGALLLARVCNDRGVLYTTNPALLEWPNLPVSPVRLSVEMSFPEPIESAYLVSLALRLPTAAPFAGNSADKGDACFAG